MKEPVSGLSHLFAGLAGVVGLFFLLEKSTARSWIQLGSLTVFGISMVLLFFSSALFHLVSTSKKAELWLMKLDHGMIYVFIAGSYTPFCVIALKGEIGRGLLLTVWLLVGIGFLLKLFWIEAPLWVSTGFYLAFGWLSLFFLPWFYSVLGFNGVLLLVGGGLFYTGGAFIHAWEKPNPFPPYLGFHEIWHFLVILGSAAHYFCISKYLI